MGQPSELSEVQEPQSSPIIALAQSDSDDSPLSILTENPSPPLINKNPPIVNLFKLIQELQPLERIQDYIQKHNIDINERHPYFDNTRLIYEIAALSPVAVLRYFIEVLNADISAEKCVNLFYAALNKPENLEYLSNYKNKIYERFNDGTTMLDAAAIRGDKITILSILKENPQALLQEKINLPEEIENNDEEEEDELFIRTSLEHRFMTLFFWAAFGGYNLLVFDLINHSAFTQLQRVNSLVLNKDSDKKFYLLHTAYLGATERKSVYDGLIDAGMNAEPNIKIEMIRALDQAIDYINYMTIDLLEGLILNENDRRWIEGLFRILDYLKNQKSEMSGDKKNLKIKISKKTGMAQEIIKILTPSPALQENITAWGFNYVATESEGDCFFHAIAYQCIINGVNVRSESINLMPIDMSAIPFNGWYYSKFYRNVAVDRMQKNFANFYQFFVPEEYLVNGDVSYLTHLRQPTTWADHDLIIALINALNITLVIIENTPNSQPKIFKSVEPRYVFYVAFDGNHYFALTRSAQASDFVIAQLNSLIENQKDTCSDGDDDKSMALPVFDKSITLKRLRGEEDEKNDNEDNLTASNKESRIEKPTPKPSPLSANSIFSSSPETPPVSPITPASEILSDPDEAAHRIVAVGLDNDMWDSDTEVEANDDDSQKTILFNPKR